MKQTAIGLIALGIVLAMPADAQVAHDHGHHAPAGNAVPQAAGQDIFEAIAEIVTILSEDADTDWSRVDIGALHRHLLDMDALATQAAVTSEPVPGGLRMHISRSGPGGEAAGRMVPMHGPILSGETGWRSAVEVEGNTIIWSVTAASEAEAEKIRALGFFGLMARGAHHQRHHLAIARGHAMH